MNQGNMNIIKILFVKKIAKIQLLYQIIMNIYAQIKLQKEIIIMIIIKVYIRNVLILVKNVTEKEMKQIIIAQNVNLVYIFK